MSDPIRPTANSDYKGFGEHLIEWQQLGIPYGTRDLIRLARLYNTPIPGTEEYEKEFAFKKDKK